MSYTLKLTSPKTKPQCPVCGYYLEGCGNPLPRKGKGFCGAGSVYFDFELDMDETKAKVKKDKDGNLYKEGAWKISGDESKHQ